MAAARRSFFAFAKKGVLRDLYADAADRVTGWT
jgi:hypothetical protein